MTKQKTKLTGWKTVHSIFKLPLILDEQTFCTIPAQSQLADLIRQSTLIVWDEASMSSRFALEAVDRTLQDIIGVHRPFGGKVLLLCGDFRQILPIVPKETDRTKREVVQHSIKKSPLWQLFRVLRLRVNMRVQMAPNAQDATDLQEFSEFLLRICEARHPTFPSLDAPYAKLPRDMVLSRTGIPQEDVRSLVDRVYPDIDRYYQNSGYFSDRTILSPRNVDVTAINNCVLERLTEPEQEYLSIFQIRRKQFPVQVCFAMTINKAQGQSLHNVGVYLPTEVFAHGQLYVALSRVTSRPNISVLVVDPAHENEDGVAVKNVVYLEVVSDSR